MSSLTSSRPDVYPRVHYDKNADVLYISLGKPVPSVSREDPEIEGLHFRYSIRGNRLSGATVVWYSRQDKKSIMSRLPFKVDLP
ncbi:MAG: DUF2283 domain-containing protein [Firmicutes bacterium]|nr:DUF2283 domain-containing protein [Bacillota bacterium]